MPALFGWIPAGRSSLSPTPLAAMDGRRRGREQTEAMEGSPPTLWPSGDDQTQNPRATTGERPPAKSLQKSRTPITVTVTQHTLNQQVANLSAVGVVTPMTFNLDGGPVVINLTNTGPLSFYIVSGTADCHTSTGT